MIIITNNVVFDEDISWDWSNAENKSVLINLDANEESKTDLEVQASGDTLSNDQ